MIVFPPITIAYLDSYYSKSMIHATYIRLLKILSIGVFIECGYGFEMGMGRSILW